MGMKLLLKFLKGILKIDLLKKISQFCSQNKISNFNFFMAVYAIYLSRVSNLKDFVIGTPILNRTNFKEFSRINFTCFIIIIDVD